MRDPLLHTLRRACREHDLLRPGPLVVAVSGGADSVCLLHLLHRLGPAFGLRLHVAHFQHGLRGAAAAEDARFIAALADALGLPATFGGADVASDARATRRSLEAAAHDRRWAFLEAVRWRIGGGDIAVGHTLDDQAETVLLHLLRGSGLAGLAGLPPRRGRVVRPLLTIRHAAAVAWCQAHNIAWREDATNAEPWCRRNAVRLEALPLLRGFNPGLEATLGATAEALQADLAYLLREAAAALSRLVTEGADGRDHLDIAGYRALPEALRRHLLLLWLGGGSNPAVIRHGHPRALDALLKEGRAGSDALTHATVRALDALLREGRAGAAATLPGGRQLVVQYGDAVQIEPGEAAALPAVTLRVPGVTLAPGWGWRITTMLDGPGSTVAERWIARLDAAAVDLPLVLRSRQPGDRMALPSGAGSKKLQDILVDAKIPRRERARVGVVEARNGIVWLAGRRVAGWARATERSARVLTIRVEPAESGG